MYHLLALSLLLNTGRADTVVELEGISVLLEDRILSPRSEAVAQWLASELHELGLAGELHAVREHGFTKDRVADGVLYFSSTHPQCSRDSSLKLLTYAAYALLQQKTHDEQAWASALELTGSRYPDRWIPFGIYQCCPDHEALASSPPPWRRAPRTETPHTTVAIAGRLSDLVWGHWPLGVGRVEVWAPLKRVGVTGAGELLPSGQVELRAGLGSNKLTHWQAGILGAVSADPILAFNDQDPSGPEPTIGIWGGLRAGSLDLLVRGSQSVKSTGIDGRAFAHKELELLPALSVSPWVGAQGSAGDPNRIATLATAPGGMRWLAAEAMPIPFSVSASADLQLALATGRLALPKFIRPSSIFARLGADYSLAYGSILSIKELEQGLLADPDRTSSWGNYLGYAAALGVSLNPLGEVKGSFVVTVAVPYTLSSHRVLLSLSTRYL